MSQAAIATAMQARGKTFYDGGTIDTNNLGGTDWEGWEREFPDLAPTATAPRTPFRVRCRAMRNVMTIAALPKRAVSNVSGANWGKRFDGYTDVVNDRLFAGVVDEHLPSAGCPVNDICWVVVYGPTLVITDLATGEQNSIGIGDILGCLAAASSEATTAGRVGAALPRNATAGETGVYQAVAYNIGRALSARTTNETNADVLAFITRY